MEFMKRCLELANRGRYGVTPNPMVGCVIVKAGEIVAEGWHSKFGGAHAEALALKRAGGRAKRAVLYVNLEPCSHHGKTPPCADAIIGAGISRVVIASVDPNPLVRGQGIRKLRSAGIKVEVGALRRESIGLNEKFFHFMETGLPFVAVKLAQTLDGKIADAKGHSKWITSLAARTCSHGLRAGHHAVLVGAGTIRKDDPLLTVRHVRGRNPLRIILDGRFSVNEDARALSALGGQTTVITTAQSLKRHQAKAIRLEKKGVQVLGIEGKEIINTNDVLKAMGSIGIASILVEGGAITVRKFLENKSVEKIHCFIAPKVMGRGLSGLSFDRRGRRSWRIVNTTLRAVGPDALLEADVNYGSGS